jgi:hypothetical protein
LLLLTSTLTNSEWRTSTLDTRYCNEFTTCSANGGRLVVVSTGKHLYVCKGYLIPKMSWVWCCESSRQRLLHAIVILEDSITLPWSVQPGPMWIRSGMLVQLAKPVVETDGTKPAQPITQLGTGSKSVDVPDSGDFRQNAVVALVARLFSLRAVHLTERHSAARACGLKSNLVVRKCAGTVYFYQSHPVVCCFRIEIVAFR